MSSFYLRGRIGGRRDDGWRYWVLKRCSKCRTRLFPPTSCSTPTRWRRRIRALRRTLRWTLMPPIWQCKKPLSATFLNQDWQDWHKHRRRVRQKGLTLANRRIPCRTRQSTFVPADNFPTTGGLRQAQAKTRDTKARLTRPRAMGTRVTKFGCEEDPN